MLRDGSWRKLACSTKKSSSFAVSLSLAMVSLARPTRRMMSSIGSLCLRTIGKSAARQKSYVQEGVLAYIYSVSMVLWARSMGRPIQSIADGLLCASHTLLFQCSHVEHRYGLRKALEREFSQGLGLKELCQRHIDPLADENLAPAGLSTQAGGEVSNRSNGRVVHPTFKADHAQGSIALGNTHPKIERVSALLPLTSQFAHLLPHANGHAHRPSCRVGAGDRVIEKDHQAIASKALQCAFIAEDQLPQGCVIFP